MILPSSLRWRICQTFKTFRILVMLSKNFVSFWFSLLYEKLLSDLMNLMLPILPLKHLKTSINESISILFPIALWQSWQSPPSIFENSTPFHKGARDSNYDMECPTQQTREKYSKHYKVFLFIPFGEMDQICLLLNSWMVVPVLIHQKVDLSWFFHQLYLEHFCQEHWNYSFILWMYLHDPKSRNYVLYFFSCGQW